jgi:hypothetical protein
MNKEVRTLHNLKSGLRQVVKEQQKTLMANLELGAEFYLLR